MSRATEAMLAELRESIPEIPDGAVTLAEIMAATGLTYNPATLVMRRLVAGGTWRRAKRGVAMWYWKT